MFLAVARLEKEKKDLQDQFGKELHELRGQTSALYEVRYDRSPFMTTI